ncbi:MAG TPA: diacylglycerol kinase family protein [Candidatus Acidoferrales bacterium]|nr:diacylglycerol kinase family protein [Candidatus Acidoferrales bacterium]
MTVRVRIIDNPWSFRGPYPAHRVLPILRDAGWDVDVAHRGRRLSVRRQVEEALDAGAGLVVGAGGDGTLRDVADALVGTNVPLGVLPGGTANLWAHELGVARSPEHAARALVDADVRRMDMGRIAHPDGRFIRFLLMSGVGMDGLVLHHTDPRLKTRLGPAGIAVGALRAIPAYRPFDVELSVDGRPAWEGRLLQLIVGNSRLYANVVHATPDALVDDGMLDVTIVPAGDLQLAVRLGWTLALRRRPDGDVPRFRGRELELRALVAPPMEVDGSPVRRRALEGTEGRPFRIVAEPLAIAVRVPRSYQGDLFGRPVAPPTVGTEVPAGGPVAPEREAAGEAGSTPAPRG